MVFFGGVGLDRVTMPTDSPKVAVLHLLETAFSPPCEVMYLHTWVIVHTLGPPETSRPHHALLQRLQLSVWVGYAGWGCSAAAQDRVAQCGCQCRSLWCSATDRHAGDEGVPVLALGMCFP